ncbi:uncharacterized protein [Pyxicephalus adspersus]|uniref:Uncharacterized protein n=2 Tax=Pyxicephalus adspersus TaxID=30357 RepID=A0AAV3A1Q1_PYXAD|nr:TPA: hypothetical protein GDO54_017248 [Pyxicephalus adspersus]
MVNFLLIKCFLIATFGLADAFPSLPPDRDVYFNNKVPPKTQQNDGMSTRYLLAVIILAALGILFIVLIISCFIINHYLKEQEISLQKMYRLLLANNHTCAPDTDELRDVVVKVPRYRRQDEEDVEVKDEEDQEEEDGEVKDEDDEEEEKEKGENQRGKRSFEEYRNNKDKIPPKDKHHKREKGSLDGGVEKDRTGKKEKPKAPIPSKLEKNTTKKKKPLAPAKPRKATLEKVKPVALPRTKKSTAQKVKPVALPQTKKTAPKKVKTVAPPQTKKTTLKKVKTGTQPQAKKKKAKAKSLAATRNKKQRK